MARKFFTFNQFLETFFPAWTQRRRECACAKVLEENWVKRDWGRACVECQIFRGHSWQCWNCELAKIKEDHNR